MPEGVQVWLLPGQQEEQWRSEPTFAAGWMVPVRERERECAEAVVVVVVVVVEEVADGLAVPVLDGAVAGVVADDAAGVCVDAADEIVADAAVAPADVVLAGAEPRFADGFSYVAEEQKLEQVLEWTAVEEEQEQLGEWSEELVLALSAADEAVLDDVVHAVHVGRAGGEERAERGHAAGGVAEPDAFDAGGGVAGAAHAADVEHLGSAVGRSR